MKLNKYGEIVKYCWNDLTNHYHNCLLNTYIIMPDHFHGIVQIINIYSYMGNGVDDVGNRVDTVGNGFKPFPTVNIMGYYCNFKSNIVTVFEAVRDGFRNAVV